MSEGLEGADYREPTPGDSLSSPSQLEPEPEPEAPVETRQQRVVGALHGERLDKILVSMAPEFSRSHLQGLIEQGHVRVDGALAGVASRRLRAAQSVQVELVPTEESQAFQPQPIALKVIYEDEHLLVLDKPAGLVVHPARAGVQIGRAHV